MTNSLPTGAASSGATSPRPAVAGDPPAPPPASITHSVSVAADAECNDRPIRPPPPPLPPREPCPEFGPGWTVQSVPRGSGNASFSKTKIDRFWFSPGGRKFRSAREVGRFLGEDQAGAMMKDDDDYNYNDDGEEEPDFDAKEDEDHRVVDPFLDEPLKNIRVKVNVFSNEIVGVRGDPVAEGGRGRGRGGGKEYRIAKADINSEDARNGEADGGVGGEVEDVMMMDLPPTNGGGDEMAPSGNEKGDGKASDVDDDNAFMEESGQLDVATNKAINRAVVYKTDSGGDDDDEDPGERDDSSYDGSNGDDKSDNGDDDGKDNDDEDDNDDDDESSNRVVSDASSKPTPPEGYSNYSLLNATVRLISGRYKGWVGRVVEVKRGWFTLESSSGVNGSVRARDLEVLEYADGTKVKSGSERKPEAAGEKATSSEDKTSLVVKDQGDDAIDIDGEEIDIMGAVIRVRNGRHVGLQGVVNERLSYRHVQLEPSDPYIAPVHLSNIKVLRHRNGADRTSRDLTKKYMGAMVRVLPPDDNAGAEGRVVKVIVGDWYITDNPAITNAYRADKFEVLKYCPSAITAAKRRVAERRTAESVSDANTAQNGKGGKREGEGEAKAGKSAKSKASNIPSSNHKPKKDGRKAKKEEAIDLTNDEEGTSGEEEQRSELRGGASAASDAVDDAAVSMAAATTSTTRVAPGQGATAAAGVATAAHTQRRGRSPSDPHEARSLIGATIRIKKGRFKGLTTVVKEKQSIRRLQLDAVPPPLEFADVEVLRFAADAGEGADDFARKYRKYVGAEVRVLRPLEYEGIEGRVIRVIVLGDWYIMDNPDIASAFPEHKFDIIQWPPDQEEEVKEEGNDDGEANGNEKREGKSEEEEKGDEGNDNLRSATEGEGFETKESTKEEEIEAPRDSADWGNNGTEYRPDSPKSIVMDVEEEEANVARSDGVAMETGHGAKNAASSVSDKKDSISEEDDAKEKITIASNNKNQDSASGEDNETRIQNANEEELSMRSNEKQNDEGNEDETFEKEVVNDEAIASIDDEKHGGKTPVGTDHNQEMGEREEESSKSPPPSADVDPLVGATAYVYVGRFQGLTGKILMTAERGWWTLDNPLVTKKVQCSNCKLVDDGMVDIETIRARYVAKERTGEKNRMPPVVNREWVERHPPKGEAGLDEHERGEDAIVMGKIENEKDESCPFKRKITETDFTGDKIFSKQRENLGVVEGSGAAAASQEDYSGRKRSRGPKVRESTVPALNPLVLHLGSGDGNFAAAGGKRKKGQVFKIELLPAGLRQLPPDTKIEIFNRRTGKIMRGDNAILLSDLPAALIDHAEYEPIVPPPSNSSVTSRIGRSGPNVRVNSNVVPQTRVRASRVEGRSVLVTGGEYRGLNGKIDSCIPGGWYQVSNLFNNDNLHVVISSRHLELIPENVVAFTSNVLSEGQGTKKIRIHLKAAKLRLEAFAEERKRLSEGSSEHAHGRKALAQLAKLDMEVKKTNKLIAKLQLSLDHSEGISLADNANVESKMH